MKTDDEVRAAIADLRGVGVELLTIGQYLQPSGSHFRSTKWWHPDEFAELREYADGLGYSHVESGPLVRSSYHAREGAGRVAYPSGSRAVADRFAELSPELAQWWREQPMFFVATAPAGEGGHVNLSPKGYDTLRVLRTDGGSRTST